MDAIMRAVQRQGSWEARQEHIWRSLLKACRTNHVRARRRQFQISVSAQKYLALTFSGLLTEQNGLANPCSQALCYTSRRAENP